MSQVPPEVARMVKGSMVVFPILSVLFWLGTPLGWWGCLCLAFLLELLPALSLAQLPLVQDDDPLPRIPVYVSSTVIILGIGVVSLLAGWGDFGLELMGLGPVRLISLLAWTGGLSLVALGLLGTFLIFRRAVGLQETPLLAGLLPQTVREKLLFVCLSFAAGIGEELAYRGFLIPGLTLVLGWDWGAALLSSVVFGLLHAYQGWLGIVRTAALGMVLAASFILSGSLWPAILAHAILDVVAGVVLGETLVKE